MPLLCFRHTTQKDFGQQLNWEENTQPMASILPGKGWASGHYPNPVNQKPAASTARRQATEKYTLKNPVTVQELLDNIFFLRCQSICHHWWLTCKEHKEILVHQSNHSWKTMKPDIKSGCYLWSAVCTVRELFHASAVCISDTGTRWETGQWLNYDGMNFYFHMIDNRHL